MVAMACRDKALGQIVLGDTWYIEEEKRPSACKRVV
jgi:hypothetical protein